MMNRVLAVTCLLAVLQASPLRASESAAVIPPPTADMAATDETQVAVIAGGCFWGVQAVYQHTEGVIRAMSGYAGGTAESANYKMVSAGRTDHAEAVEIRFDPRKISYGKILQIFFSVAHNPTELDRQGPDVGRQYRSAIFFANAEQKRVAEAYVGQLNASGAFERPIVTRIDPLKAFYDAEAYHQDYAHRHPDQPYIAFHDLPKIDNLEKVFPELYRSKPVLVGLAER